MPIYLDSAVLAEVEEADKLGFVAGVTTNPTLVRQAAEANRARGLLTREAVYSAILSATAGWRGLVFAQVRAGSLEAMAAEAASLRRLDPVRLGIKIPCTVEGLSLARRLAADGVPTLVTAVYTPAQAYLSAEAGATMIAPYVHRWEVAYERPGGEFVAELRRALEAAGGRTRILAASLKSVEAALEALLAGAHAVTVPLPVLRDFPLHPLTAQALAQFDADYDEIPK
ncbi:MAG: transaldolase family protein [Bacillota bacterium]|nr:transaldolase family protein [Bacillota bacterium]